MNLAAKVTVVGNYSVGKTSLALRFCRGSLEREPTTTIAVDFWHQRIQVDNTTVNLQIWDTAGQDKYASVVPHFIRSSAVVILVYDVTDVASFTALSTWLIMAKDEAPEASIVLVANKVDAAVRNISRKQGNEFASRHGLTYLETSAKSGRNVNKLFIDIATNLVKRHEKPITDNELGSIKLQCSTNSLSKKESTCLC